MRFIIEKYWQLSGVLKKQRHLLKGIQDKFEI